MSRKIEEDTREKYIEFERTVERTINKILGDIVGVIEKN
jgi:hypothetical protein